ncbi:hypothetical protein BC830DRAFT_1100190 [Chytriomyces sp. MP71]|nr:hypothetical protein BC830DRAFT_1100190 [Chytriomyces sp. MP71]
MRGCYHGSIMRLFRFNIWMKGHSVKNDRTHDPPQAGTFFPDWGYACASKGDAAEEAHWPPFWKAAFAYLHSNYPPSNSQNASLDVWGDDAIPLLSFLLGVVAHGVTDYTWHSLDQRGWGFVEALGFLAFNGSFTSAHLAADKGGEMVLAHSIDLNSFLVNSWRVPTGDVVAIYKTMGYEVSVTTLNFCMTQGFLATQGVRVGGRYAFPHWAQEAPPLVDLIQTYPHGGIHSTSLLIAQCWTYLLHNDFKNIPSMPKICAGGISSSIIPSSLVEGDEQAALSHGVKGARRINVHAEHHVDSPRWIGVLADWCRGWRVRIVEDPVGGASMKLISWNPLRMHRKTADKVIELPSDFTASFTERAGLAPVMVIRSVLVEALSEMLSIIKAVLFGDGCHSVDYIDRVSKTSLFTTSNPFADLGAAIASGNFTGPSDRPHLALGAPGYTRDSVQQGAVFLFSNMSQESMPLHTKISVEELAGVTLLGPAGSRFGQQLAVLDLNLDGFPDLVVGAPWEADKSGAVYVFYGGQGVHQRQCGATRCVTHAREADLVIRATSGVLGFGLTLAVGDVDGDGAADLVVGAPYSGTPASPNRGAVFAFKSVARKSGSVLSTARDALWILKPNLLNGAIDFEEFGRAILVLPETQQVIVSSPGFRGSYAQNAQGKVTLFQNLFGSRTPVPVGSVVGIHQLTAFGSALHAYDTGTEKLVLVSAPTEISNEARAKFMNFPGLLTPTLTRGYSAGAIHLLRVSSFMGSFNTPLQNVTLKTIRGSQSNARFGGSGLVVEGSDMWVAEALADGESGRVRRIELILDREFTVRKDGRRTRHPGFWGKMFPNLQCMSGSEGGDRFGVTVAKMGFDKDGGDHLLVASGSGVVRMFW